MFLKVHSNKACPPIHHLRPSPILPCLVRASTPGNGRSPTFCCTGSLMAVTTSGNVKTLITSTTIKILCALLEHAVQEAEPFLYIDTHAGSGLYDLSSPEAMRFENYRSGIQNVATSEQATTLRTMHGFFSAVRLVNVALGEESLRYYPGSPAIAQHFLRPQDSALVFEASRQVCEVLQASLLKLKQDAGCALSTTVVCANSYEWFAGCREVPGTSTSRVLALVDPPYDSASSSDKWNLFLLKHLTMRWPSSCILLWCPHIADQEMNLGLSWCCTDSTSIASSGSALCCEMHMGAHGRHAEEDREGERERETWRKKERESRP